MVRDFFINGETLVAVKGQSDSVISSITELGLADSPIRITPNFRFHELQVDAWGGMIPVDVQCMLSDVSISMTLIHYDQAVLRACVALSMGGAVTEGLMPRAGRRLGGGLPRFAPGGPAGNHYIGLNLTSPVAGLPWRFYFCYLIGPPMEWPLGTEASAVALNWRAVPYTVDPYNAGTGSLNSPLWDHVLDN